MADPLRFGQGSRPQADTNLFALNQTLSQVAMLPGRAGGQTLYGGTAAGETLKLFSTSSATKGKISIGNILIIDGATSNVNFAGSSPDFQSGQRIWFFRNRAAAPTGNPVNGGFLYASSGALVWRGSSGTITTIAPA